MSIVFVFYHKLLSHPASMRGREDGAIILCQDDSAARTWRLDGRWACHGDDAVSACPVWCSMALLFHFSFLLGFFSCWQSTAGHGASTSFFRGEETMRHPKMGLQFQRRATEHYGSGINLSTSVAIRVMLAN